MPKYQNRHLQRAYELALKAARERQPDLFTEDGRQRRGSTSACAFWDGYNGAMSRLNVPGSMCTAFFQAGKTFRRLEAAKVKRPLGRPALAPDAENKPRTVRLNDARWAKYKTLGSAWLEARIDEA